MAEQRSLSEAQVAGSNPAVHNMYMGTQVYRNILVVTVAILGALLSKSGEEVVR